MTPENWAWENGVAERRRTGLAGKARLCEYYSSRSCWAQPLPSVGEKVAQGGHRTLT